MTGVKITGPDRKRTLVEKVSLIPPSAGYIKRLTMFFVMIFYLNRSSFMIFSDLFSGIDKS